MKADISGVSPSSERIKELLVVYCLQVERWICTIAGNMETLKTRIN